MLHFVFSSLFVEVLPVLPVLPVGYPEDVRIVNKSVIFVYGRFFHVNVRICSSKF